MRREALLATALLLAGCSSGEDFVRAYGERDPQLERIAVCHGYGCAYKTMVAVDPTAWALVARLFHGPLGTPPDERRRIALAIGLIEEMVGAATGTAGDEARASLFASDRFQQDCIDEAVNTTTYLRLMAGSGLLRHHAVGAAAGRGHFIDRWPHNTAVITERGSGESFAVDSWFHANGEPAEIVPLAVWQSGWSPNE